MSDPRSDEFKHPEGNEQAAQAVASAADAIANAEDGSMIRLSEGIKPEMFEPQRGLAPVPALVAEGESMTEEQLAEASASVRVELLAKSVLALKQTYEAQTQVFVDTFKQVNEAFAEVGRRIAVIGEELDGIKATLTNTVLERANASGATPIQRVEALEKAVGQIDANFKPGC